MGFNIGVNLVETDGPAVPAIVAVPVSITGFLVRSQRGVPHWPVTIRGFADYVASFGGYTEDDYGSYAVRGFFDNGGTEAVVTRVEGSSATPASVTLVDRAGAPVNTLILTAGVRGREDPGTWGNALSVTITDHPRAASAIPAQITGSETEPFALGDGDTLEVAADGSSTSTVVTFHTVDFTDINAASAVDVAAVINRQTSVFRASAAGGQLVIASANPGPRSRLVVTGGDAALPLGFDGATENSDLGLPSGSTRAVLQSVGGLLSGSAVRLQTRGHVIADTAITGSVTDGAGIKVTVGSVETTVLFTASDFAGGVGTVTPGELVAAINRQAQGFTAALIYDDRLVIMSNSFGDGSTVNVEPPDGPEPDASADLGFDLVASPPVSGMNLYRTLDTVDERNKAASWTTGLGPNFQANFARLRSEEFDLIVTRSGVEVERFESLSMQDTLDYYVETALNDAVRGSRFVIASDLDSASGVGLDVPALGVFPLTSGTDDPPTDADFTGDPAARTGLYAFDTSAIQLLVCPETTAAGVMQACLSYCEARGDAMFIGTAPDGYDLEGIKTYASVFRARKVYGALYAPWIEIVNPLDTDGSRPRRWIPPVGQIAGVYARIARERGIWKAPAGDEARLRNVIGVAFDMTDADHTDLVKNGGVNGVRAIPGSGIVVDASRTLSTDTRWWFVNVRRLFNFVKSSLRDSLRWVAQEPNDASLRQRVTFNVVRPFLLGLWRQGAFGSDPAEDVFTIICDETNNPPQDVNLGIFRIEVYFYPVKPAESIVIIVGQQDSGATIEES